MDAGDGDDGDHGERKRSAHESEYDADIMARSRPDQVRAPAFHKT
jgi:hypothetical protein